MLDNHQNRPKTVILIITGSSKEQLSIGVEVRFSDNNTLVDSSVSGKLLPLPQELLDAYTDWKRGYLAWGETCRYWQRTIAPPSNPIETNASIQNCDVSEERLIQEFNSWLDVHECPGLSKVAAKILTNVAPQEYKDRPELLSFIVQTRISDAPLDLDLQKLPWNEWEFIRSHYSSGIALSTNTAPIIKKQQHKLKALVICGHYDELDNQIDLQPDLDAVQLHLSDIVDLEFWKCDATNSKFELLRKLDESVYHLLFFSGHSSSNNQIQLNDSEYILVDDNKFKEILKQLRNKGLILAFFNSCDGLGIARSLMAVGIPYVVVMKELVHDCVAQEFIKGFLQQAIQPEIPIHIAVNETRLKLQWLQGLPHGEFLPVLFQNPEQPPLYLNPQLISTADIQPEKIAKLLSVRLKFKRVRYFIIAAVLAIAILICSAIPDVQERFWTAMSPPICKFAYDTVDISCGEEILLSKPNGNSSSYKIDGFRSIGKGVNNSSAYRKAIDDLEKDWKSEHDPETFIAIENARIVLESIDNPSVKIKNIAVVVPAKQNTPYYVADSLLKGVAYAQKQQNFKNNWKLRVLIADDANNKVQSQKIAKKLVDRKDISGVIGHYSSNVTIPIVNGEKTYKDKTVLISSTATADELNSINAEQFFFRLAPSSKFSAQGMVRKWMKPGRKIVLFYQSSDGKFSLSLRQAFKDAIMNDRKYSISNTIVKEFDLSKSNNIKNEIEQAKKANANSIVLFPDAYTGDNKTNNKAEEVMVHNKGEMPILTNTSVYDSYEQKYRTPSIKVLPGLYENVVMSIPWEYSNRKTRYSQELILKDDPSQLPAVPKWWLFEGESIDMLNQRIALSHDATSVLIEAIERAEDAGRGDDNKYIKKIIASKTFAVEGITGKISFNGNSDRVEQMDSLVTPKCDENECKGFKVYNNE